MKLSPILLTLFMFPLTASALVIVNGKNVNIRQPVRGDLYIAGGTVTINAPVYGDLIIAGGTITINNNISNDIIIAGGRVVLNGFVGDDIRGVFGRITINGRINGDIVVSGGNILVDNGSIINGNLIAGGGMVTMNGNIKGGIKCMAGELILNGMVGKRAECKGGNITINGIINGKSVLAAENITIGEKAAFYQDVRYWNRSEKLEMKTAQKKGNIMFDPTLQLNNEKWLYLGFASVLGLIWYLAVVYMFILIIQYFFGRVMSKASEVAYSHTVRSIGYGFLYFIAIPIVVFLLVITVIGIPVAILLLLAYITLALLATVITSVVIANRIKKTGSYKWNTWWIANAAIGIFIILKLIYLIPVLGWILMPVITCLVFGSILLNIRRQQQKEEFQIT